jgi:Flp pilus assembly CpaE family ATPase
MMIYLLTSDPSINTGQIDSIETKLKSSIPELHKIEKIEDIADEISGKHDKKIIVIFVAPELPNTGIDKIINVANRYRHRVFFILVSNEISGADYKRLVRSGGADWVAAGGSLQEIPELIYKQNLPAEVTGKEVIRPTIVSFLPAMGGVGNTTIALEVALSIKTAKATRSWKLCYIDCDFQTSHVCDYLDIEARLQINDIADHPERLDEQLFELFITHHNSGLDVFAAPRSKLDPFEIDTEVLDPLLEMVSAKYDFVVLDLPVPWFNWTPPLLENSDAIVLTGINTIPCLRQMKSTLDEVLNLKTVPPHIALAMNRVTHNLIGGVERRKHILRVFPNEEIIYVEEDSKAVDRANTGTPAVLGGGQAKNFAKIASFCSNLRQITKRANVR